LVEANGNQKSAASVHRAGGLTVYELFAAQVSRDVTAIAIEQGELRLTYAALDARVRKLAGALLDMGVTRGKRIALLSENRHEYIEIQLAAAFIGAIVACQNWRLAPAELRHCVALVSPSLIIASERFAARVEALEIDVPVRIIERDHEVNRLDVDIDVGQGRIGAEFRDGLIFLLALYDGEIRDVRTDDYRDIANVQLYGDEESTDATREDSPSHMDRLRNPKGLQTVAVERQEAEKRSEEELV